MLIDLLERGDVAVTAIPVDQERADAGSSSPGHVLLRRIADMERLARLASRQLQRTFEDRGIRLAGARPGWGPPASAEVIVPSSSSPSPQPSSTRGSEQSQFDTVTRRRPRSRSP